MKCPKCGGNGFVPTNVFGVNVAIKCDFCDGTGVFITNAVELLTNEEWIKSANTEQLAEFLSKVGELDEAPIPCCDLMECSKNCGLYSQCAGDDVMPTNEEIWVEWLKQPHRE